MAAFQCYRNLRKPGVTYSLRQRGKVFGYAQHIHLKAVTAKHATPAALARIRTGVREVSVWLNAESIETDDIPDTTGWRSLTCDPKRHDFVCDWQTGERLDSFAEVVLTSDERGEHCRAYYR